MKKRLSFFLIAVLLSPNIISLEHLFSENKNINVIFAVIGMFNELRTWNKKNIKNYVEIFIKANIEKLKKQKKRRLYKYNKNVVGIHIKPQFPKKPDIVINNNF